MKHNYVAKHMNTYNRASVVPDKRDKHLDDVYEQEIAQGFEQELKEEEDDPVSQ